VRATLATLITIFHCIVCFRAIEYWIVTRVSFWLGLWMDIQNLYQVSSWPLFADI
jgi:hypothetical protein